MFKLTITSRNIWQAFAVVSAIAISLAAASAALAGECPADKIKPNVRQMVDYKPVGVTDVTLGAIDLGKQPARIEGRELRFRKLTIEPGGIVPWHSHDDRPALTLSSKARSWNTQATASIRSCTRRATCGRRSMARRIGGRTSAKRPSFSMSATSARIRPTTTYSECSPHASLPDVTTRERPR